MARIFIGNIKGTPGSPGKNGASATHEWNGTELIITSASGTSRADLKGDKGDAYALTETDKNTIAAAVKSNITTADINGAADTNYTALKARAESLNSAETTPGINGAIAWTYE